MLLLQQRAGVADEIEVANVVSTGVDGVGQRPDRESSRNEHLRVSLDSIISTGATLACSCGYAHEHENEKGTRAKDFVCASRCSHFWNAI